MMTSTAVAVTRCAPALTHTAHPQRQYRPRQSRAEVMAIKQQTRLENLERFKRLKNPLQIISHEVSGRDFVVKTNVGYFRVHRKGHITGPFPGEPLPFTRATLIYFRTTGLQWECHARKTDLNFQPMRVSQTWCVRLTRIRTAVLGLISKGRKLAPLSPEHRAKISVSIKGKNAGKYVGRKLSRAWRANLSAAQKVAWQRRRASPSA